MRCCFKKAPNSKTAPSSIYHPPEDNKIETNHQHQIAPPIPKPNKNKSQFSKAEISGRSQSEKDSIEDISFLSNQIRKLKRSLGIAKNNTNNKTEKAKIGPNEGKGLKIQNFERILNVNINDSQISQSNSRGENDDRLPEELDKNKLSPMKNVPIRTIRKKSIEPFSIIKNRNRIRPLEKKKKQITEPKILKRNNSPSPNLIKENSIKKNKIEFEDRSNKKEKKDQASFNKSSSKKDDSSNKMIDKVSSIYYKINKNGDLLQKYRNRSSQIIEPIFENGSIKSNKTIKNGPSQKNEIKKNNCPLPIISNFSSYKRRVSMSNFKNRNRSHQIPGRKENDPKSIPKRIFTPESVINVSKNHLRSKDLVEKDSLVLREQNFDRLMLEESICEPSFSLTNKSKEKSFSLVMNEFGSRLDPIMEQECSVNKQYLRGLTENKKTEDSNLVLKKFARYNSNKVSSEFLKRNIERDNYSSLKILTPNKKHISSPINLFAPERVRRQLMSEQNSINQLENTILDVTIDGGGNQNLNEYRVLNLVGTGAFCRVHRALNRIDKKYYVRF